MISKEELVELSSIQSRDYPVLSVYLDTTPSQSEGKVYRLVLKELLKDYESQIDDKKGKKVFTEEIARTIEYVEAELKPTGNGVALFSCSRKGLWQVFHLPMAVPNTIRFQTSPYAKPLMSIINGFQRECVVLVDKGRARLFLMQMGEIEEYTESSYDLPAKHKQGGRSQANFQRRHDAHVSFHLKDVIEQLSTYDEKAAIDCLIIAGPGEARSSFQKMLPKALEDKVGGVFSASLNASAASIRAGAAALLASIDKFNKVSMVTSAINLARQGGPAVLGVEETLAALQEGRIHSLIVTEDFTASGFACSGCSYLSVTPKESCPRCGKPLTASSDIIDKAIALTWERDGRVETIRGEAANSLIKASGDGIAGIAWF